MPNTNPPLDTPESIRYIVDKADDLPIHIFPIGAITHAQEGLEVTVPDTIDVNGTLSKITEPFSLPMTFRLGIMKDITLGSEDSDHSLIVTMDMINPIDYTLYGTFGMEYSWKDIGYVRVGQRFGHDTAKWSLGGGFRLGADGFKVGLDYAYVNYDVLDFTHQFGIKFEF